MSKLIWDAIGERLYETGVSQCAVYPVVNNAYPKGYAWNGITGVTESPSGADSNPQYADNIKYLNLISSEEYGATVTAFTYPNEFAECDGSAEVVPGVRVGQQTRKPFGLVYKTILGNDTSGVDYGYKLHMVYNALASPSEKAYNTVNDSPEANEFSWEVTTTPVNVGEIGGVKYKPTAQLTITSTEVDADKLAALEDVLYGTENEDAHLPLPAEIITMMGGEATVEISLNRANLKLSAGQSYSLKATTIPEGETVTFASDNTSYATVNSSTGKVTGVAEGTAVITASMTKDGITYTDKCTVTVTAAS